MNKKVKVLTFAIIGLVIIFMLASTTRTMLQTNNLKSSSSLSKIGLLVDYKEVQTHCPVNIEFETTCIRNYYAKDSDDIIEQNILYALKMQNYLYKKLSGGYDGGNQIAYVAYNEKSNVSYVFIIMSTGNDIYKKNYGNLRTQTYLSKNVYDRHS